MDSILSSIKKQLNISDEYTHFDQDIIMCINSAMATLNQLGVGPSAGFVILDSDNTWAELLGSNLKLEFVKMYVYLKTRLIFDPPATSYLVDAMNKNIAELESRILMAVETP